MSINEVLIHARERRFSDKSDEDLNQMLVVCGNYTGQVSDVYSASQIPHAVKTIQEELSRRQREKNHREAMAEQQRLHGQTAEQGRAFHRETMADLEKIKLLAKDLSRPRWIDWAILVVGTIAAIATVIALFMTH